MSLRFESSITLETKAETIFLPKRIGAYHQPGYSPRFMWLLNSKFNALFPKIQS